ncbi:MAG: hypothetical protein IJV93_13410 [Lentisphaeria bacterium]|nr:hypothetical protein [Lentisphaeria bacterium]
MDAPKLEQAFLAALIRENNLIATAKLHAITERTFTDDRTRDIWKALAAELDAGRQADLVTLSEQLPTLIVEIAELELAISTTVNFSTWCRKLKAAEAKRELQYACSCAAKDAESKEADPAEIIRKLTASLETARITAGGRHVPTLAEAADELKANLIAAPPKLVPMFPTGTTGDQCRLRKGEMFVLGARAGGGKTALCAAAVWEQLQAGFNVAYFCTESSTADILTRIVAAASGIPHYLPSRDQYALIRFKELLTFILDKYRKQLHIFGNDAGAITPSFIRQQLRAVEADGAAEVVYVDFLQNLSPDRRLRSPLEEINASLQVIHDTLAEFKAAGIIVSQFNRQSQMAGGIPDLTWLKETSSLEQLAHTVAFLWREKGKSTTQLYSAKTRNCRPFSIELYWAETKFKAAKGDDHGDTDTTDDDRRD